MSESGFPVPSRVVDFHAHWLPREIVGEVAPPNAAPKLREAWSFLTDAAAQAAAADQAGIDVKVLSAPVEMVGFGGTSVTAATVSRTNELLAEVIAAHAPRLTALATVDVFAGNQGAEQARHAVDQLGLPGIVVGVGADEKLLDAPEARPTLEFAAERGIPVFAHPVNPPVIEPRFASVPRGGHVLARGTESALSTLALPRSGVLRDLPALKLVITLIGSAVLALAAFLDEDVEPHDRDGWRPVDDLPRLYVDTLGFDPRGIALALAAVGPDHVVIGSDWPFAKPDATPAAVRDALLAAGLAADRIECVAAGTATDLLGLREPEPVGAG